MDTIFYIYPILSLTIIFLVFLVRFVLCCCFFFAFTTVQGGGIIWEGVSFGVGCMCPPVSLRAALVAVKQMPVGKKMAEVDAMLKEITVLSQLEHPNIVSYLGSQIVMSQLVIVMEYAARPQQGVGVRPSR